MALHTQSHHANGTTEASNQPTTIAHPSTWSPSSIQAASLVHTYSDRGVSGVDPWRHGRPAKYQPKNHRQSILRRWIWIGLILNLCMFEATCTHDPSEDHKITTLALWPTKPAGIRSKITQLANVVMAYLTAPPLSSKLTSRHFIASAGA